MRLYFKALACVAVFALCGCAGLEQAVPAGQSEFELAGRIAMRYRDEAGSGNLAWRHARNADELLLTTPIGTSLARVVRNGDAVVLTTAEGREYRARNAETLTAQVLGFPLPLEGMAEWVRGRPLPGPPAQIRRDAQGRIASLVQSGWTVEYQEYRDDQLPARLKLAFPGIELRLAIHHWAEGGAVRAAAHYDARGIEGRLPHAEHALP